MRTEIIRDTKLANHLAIEASSPITQAALCLLLFVIPFGASPRAFCHNTAQGFFDKSSFASHKPDFENAVNVLEKHRSLTFASPASISFGSSEYHRNSIKSDEWLDTQGKKVKFEEVLKANGFSKQDFLRLQRSLIKIWGAAASSQAGANNAFVVMFFPGNEKHSIKTGRLEYIASASSKAASDLLKDKLFQTTKLAAHWFLVQPAR